jgi:hypothetical protein
MAGEFQPSLLIANQLTGTIGPLKDQDSEEK